MTKCAYAKTENGALMHFSGTQTDRQTYRQTNRHTHARTPVQVVCVDSH